jgi:hypothetical protein
MISRRSLRDVGDAASGTNATAHWWLGERATRQSGVTLRYTVTGYLIHHVSSVFWAAIYERWFANREESRTTAGNAATVAVLAAATDYLLTPKRFAPGFERHLSMRSMVLVYAAFAVGLALAHGVLAARDE